MTAPFADDLLRWFHDSKADLPWRHNPNPYRVWLAEIMLQQTQVNTAIPYFQRFIASFPSIKALASASIDQVLKQWEGLGYYRRAHNLHRAAIIIVERHNGQLPSNIEQLSNLPGIGRYTAGAIASIAFNQAQPALDANVMRVFARLRNLDQDITLSSTQKSLWTLAADWIPTHAPGDYNQALMELGQRICRPRNPNCPTCPLTAHCQAFANGTQNAIPRKTKRPPIPHYDVCAGIIRDNDGRLLITQRPLDAMLGGLWEFPGGKREPKESLHDCLARELREELAIEVDIGPLFTTVKHAFTHFKITLHAYDCHYLRPIPPHKQPQTLGVMNWTWTAPENLDHFSFGKADRLVIAALRDQQSRLL